MWPLIADKALRIWEAECGHKLPYVKLGVTRRELVEMRGKYKLTSMVAVLVVVLAAGALMLRLMDTPTEAVAENGADEPVATIVNEEGETVPDTRTEADLEAAYQAGETAFFGDQRYIDYVIDRTIEDAPDHVTMYGKTFGVLENGETFGRVAQYVDEDGYLTSYDPDYQPTASRSFASDGALVWVKQSDLFSVNDFSGPVELAYMAAHPQSIQVPLYATPGGEVYEYKTYDEGGLGVWGNIDQISAKYIILNLTDGTDVELSWSDYKKDPSILDQYDAEYLTLSIVGLEASRALGDDKPHEDGDGFWEDPEGKYILLLLRDGSLVTVPMAEYRADMSVIDQYDHVTYYHSVASAEEMKELGVYDEIAEMLSEASVFTFEVPES